MGHEPNAAGTDSTAPGSGPSGSGGIAHVAPLERRAAAPAAGRVASSTGAPSVKPCAPGDASSAQRRPRSVGRIKLHKVVIGADAISRREIARLFLARDATPGTYARSHNDHNAPSTRPHPHGSHT